MALNRPRRQCALKSYRQVKGPAGVAFREKFADSGNAWGTDHGTKVMKAIFTNTRDLVQFGHVNPIIHRRAEKTKEEIMALEALEASAYCEVSGTEVFQNQTNTISNHG